MAGRLGVEAGASPGSPRSRARRQAPLPVALPRRVARPRDVAGVVEVVRSSVRDGLTVRPAGSGSTTTGLTDTDGVLLEITDLDRVREVDPTDGSAVVEAGIRLGVLAAFLRARGLVLDGAALGGAALGGAALGGLTLGGALATGEHGGGPRLGGLASQVRALEMVLADGEVVRCSAAEHSDLFQAARVGLGAFGVVTAVTVVCSPARDVDYEAVDLTCTSFLDRVDELVDRCDDLDLIWTPGSDALTGTAGRRDLGTGPDAAVSDSAGPGAAGPGAGPGTGGQSTAGRGAGGRGTGRQGSGRRGVGGRRSGVRGSVARGYRVLRGRRALFAREALFTRESEYAVPRGCFPAVFDELRDRLRSRPLRTGSVRVRFGAAEDAWLALGQGRETAYLCASAPGGPAFDGFFAILSEVAARYDGRPHWGRQHDLAAEALRGRYPHFDDARAVRDRVDPRRVFTNPSVMRLLGA